MFGRRSSDESATRRGGRVTFRWASVTDTAERAADHPGGDAGSGSITGSLILTVADGFGPSGIGEEASRRAVAAATAMPVDAEVSVVERLRAGDDAVAEFARSRDDARETVSTLTIAEFTPHSTLNVAHVGDSRLYVFAASDLVQVTNDHTADPEPAEPQPSITGAGVGSSLRPRLTSACGFLGVNVQHVADLELRLGDRVLMCTGAVSSAVPDDRLAALLEDDAGAEATARGVIAAAGRAGAVGVVTVAVVGVTR